MSWRASRSAVRLASVAVSVNSQRARPKRRASSSPTAIASSVGSIVVIPRAELRAHRLDHRGRPVAGHRARVAEAEVDVLVAVDVDDPRARRLGAKTGKPPAQRIIHGIGTPPSSEPPARSNSARERGRAAANASASRASRADRRPRSKGIARRSCQNPLMAEEQRETPRSARGCGRASG